ncbi:MAG: hypothetical protein ABL998_03655 [Planctomycetota bacterium]
MHKPLVLACRTLAVLPLLFSPQAGRDDRALEPVAQALARYLSARASDEGVEEAQAAVAASLAALEGVGQGERFLARPDELERAAWLARGYAAKDVKKGRVVSEERREGRFAKKALEFAYRVPRDYDPKGRGYALILTLPDEGERPAEALRTHWIHGELLERAILVAPALPERVEDWEQVTVQGRPGGLCHVLTVLRIAQEMFALDFERVFVVGRGRSVELALAAGNHTPHTFAGLVLCAGDGRAPIPENFAALPTLFAPGGEKANTFRHALGALGIQNCELGAADDEKLLWAWMQAHARLADPERIELVVGQPFPTRSAWLRVAPSAPEARATATLDRAGNTVRVSTRGVSQVTLYLSQALLDLARPVRVLVDGNESSHALAPRLATTLELLHDGTSDPAAVYTVELALAVRKQGEPATEAALAHDFVLRLAAAGQELGALWTLHESCRAAELAREDALVLRRIVRLAPDHAEARAALGQVGANGRWFASPSALERFLASQEPAAAAARGLVLDERSQLWIHPDDRALATRGLALDPPSGLWLSASEQRKLAEGWVRQDFEWIEPAEGVRVDEGLWRVEGEWLDLATANRRHATLARPWRIPAREVVLQATTDRAVAEQALEHMGRALEDCVKVLGAEVQMPLPVFLARDEEQYDRLAFGEPDGRRAPADLTRFHLVHHAHFAAGWFRPQRGKLAFQGMGVGFWDPLVPGGDAYGVHSARLAAAYSFVEALDPSPKAIKKAQLNGPRDDYPEAYEAEKQLPAWLRHGTAVYAERFFRDAHVSEGGDPWWAVKWSRAALTQRGGLRNLTDVFPFALDPDFRDDSQRRLLEVGAVVSFVVDGNNSGVRTAHAALKRALATGALRKEHVEKLTAALLASEQELRAFLAAEPGATAR